MSRETTGTIPVAVIGSGNIGTDLMIKVMRLSPSLIMGAMVGIDPASDGLARAARLKVATTAEGIDGLLAIEVGCRNLVGGQDDMIVDIALALAAQGDVDLVGSRT